MPSSEDDLPRLGGEPGAQKNAPRPVGDGGRGVRDPGDDRLSRLSTIMGPAGLTAVFGMGTGVAPRVWSPGSRPAGGFNPAGRDFGRSADTCGSDRFDGRRMGVAYSDMLGSIRMGSGMIGEARLDAERSGRPRPPALAGGPDRGGQAARLLGPVG